MNNAFFRVDEPKRLRLSEVRDLARQSVDDDRYDAMFRQQTLAAGYYREATAAGAFSVAGVKRNPLEVSDYPDVEPADMRDGVQNHMFQDARVNAIATTATTPDWNFVHPDPFLREFNRAYLEHLWEENDFETKMLDAAIDLGVCGIGTVQLGMDRYGGPNVWRVNPLDLMGDPIHRHVSDWEWCFVRTRLHPIEVRRKYGKLVSNDEIERFGSRIRVHWSAGRKVERQAESVVEWSFWTEFDHFLFLGGIGRGEGIAFRLADDGKYERVDEPTLFNRSDPKAGPNPFGAMPVCSWSEIALPSSRRPTSKFDFHRPLATLLQHIEEAIGNTVVNGKPVTLLSAIGMEPQHLEMIRQGKSLDEVGKVILNRGLEDIEKNIHRLPAAEIPNSWLVARDIMLQETNTSTGMNDYKRGQMMPGERTRFEVEEFADQSGVQARHTRKRYSVFLVDMGHKLRQIGALWDRKSRRIPLRQGMFETDVFPIAPMLREPVSLQVAETGLQFQTRTRRNEERKREFLEIDLPLVQLGAVDPLKAAEALYRDLGVYDPQERGLMDPRELAMRQAAAMAAQQAGGDSGDPNNAATPQETPNE
ncbi:MAG: hypothetical protein KIS66_16785 [Fimbriimonadaceae bacterium]|nr:hypothetical protein [Fimbriimonadaceae bacterium]